MDSEPDHETIAGTVRTFPLLVNAMVDYPQYQCKTDKIEFKETLMFMTRNYEFTLSNTGTVPVHYNWYRQADMDHNIAPNGSNRTQEVSRQVSSEETSRSAPGTPVSPEKQSLPSLPEESPLPSPGKQSLQTVELVDLDPERETLKNVTSILREPQPLPENEEFVEFHSTQPEDEVEDVTLRETESDVTLGYVPFHIKPVDGIVLPGEEQCFVASFQPLGVGEYHATFVCRIAHKAPETQPLKIEFKGTSAMPLCHFDVEDSDYISSGRRNPKLPGPFGMSPQFILDPNMKVLEFKVLGIGETHTKEFFMINPTQSNYSFIWKNIDGIKTKPVSPFQCITPEGRVESGKQTTIQFSFMAEDIGTFESFWNFCIPKHNIEVPFMVIATVTEPAVMFVGAHIDLNPTIQGRYPLFS
ncbi:hydrocephalus-inducing protein [Anabrus simplex]|uniref:hydrocephalus-inducing protein n=1 Tax=Anabrus simplex TaxID=316456 RepID=UPI0035A35C3D